MWKNRNAHSLLGMQNGTVTLEDILAVSWKVNILFLCDQMITLGIYPNDLKMCVLKSKPKPTKQTQNKPRDKNL